MGILDYFTPEARRGNREWLDSQNAAISEALRYYLGPTGIPDRLGLLAESTPTAGLERAGAESSRMFEPGLSGAQRAEAFGNMLSETAGAGAGLLGMPVAGKMADDLVQAAAPTVGRFMGSEFGGVPVPGNIDAAAQQGSEIINLLRSGRAGEVTEQMLDMGDPVLNARLSEYLYSNYDLPMDTSSRMGRAQEMGLSQQTYHGTPYADITAMRPSEFGAVGPGVYAAGRPVTASDYSRGYGMMTPKETFDVAGERYTPGGNVMPIQTPQNLESFEDWTAAKMADMQRQGLYSSGFRADSAASQAAADAGFGGVSARNENVVIFDPANVRSRFARFDPRLSHLRNLNAAITAGVPVGLLAMQPDQGPQ